MLTFKCSACRKKIVTEDHLAGQQGECPFCKKVVVAPGAPKDEGTKRDAPRCPKCGARRKDPSSTTCSFCGASMGAPKTRSMPAPTASFEGLDKRKVLMLGALLAVGLLVAALMFMGGDDAPEVAGDELCRRQMLAMLDNLALCPGGPPPAQGSQFWIEVATKRNVLPALKCPEAKSNQRCDYRGPAKLYADLSADDPLMVCKNHPQGANIMHRSSALLVAAPGSDDFKKAMDASKE